jgi:hypothetical protein
MRSNDMRVLIFLAIVLTPATAFAASECSSIGNNRARLACFDKEQPKQPKQNVGKTDFSDRANPFAKEDAATTAKLRGICRGC